MKTAWTKWSDGDFQILLEAENEEEVAFLASFHASDPEVRWFSGDDQLTITRYVK